MRGRGPSQLPHRRSRSLLHRRRLRVQVAGRRGTRYRRWTDRHRRAGARVRHRARRGRARRRQRRRRPDATGHHLRPPSRGRSIRALRTPVRGAVHRERGERERRRARGIPGDGDVRDVGGHRAGDAVDGTRAGRGDGPGRHRTRRDGDEPIFIAQDERS